MEKHRSKEALGNKARQQVSAESVSRMQGCKKKSKDELIYDRSLRRTAASQAPGSRHL
jgi:hypothetical protein